MTKNPQFHSRSKHIGIKYHYARQQVKEGNIEIVYCPTEEMVADMLTKGLSQDKFVKFREMAGVKEM
uniref:Copia protein n=1 Tax=Amphimedon queenslandica TaxID=400682 RepID=A0A1X7TJD0_AMPQE